MLDPTLVKLMKEKWELTRHVVTEPCDREGRCCASEVACRPPGSSLLTFAEVSRASVTVATHGSANCCLEVLPLLPTAGLMTPRQSGTTILFGDTTDRSQGSPCFATHVGDHSLTIRFTRHISGAGVSFECDGTLADWSQCAAVAPNATQNVTGDAHLTTHCEFRRLRQPLLAPELHWVVLAIGSVLLLTLAAVFGVVHAKRLCRPARDTHGCSMREP
mmetsp:Transcript_89480/g.208385  ORF Transcript_89480/g.208385 Transcript_89480/m.208385 type:complete len:218 (+) Transcript_89480:45-698(+)